MEAPRYEPARTPALAVVREDQMPSSLPITIQPIPRYALVATTPDLQWTSLTRRFEHGQSAFCRLCPRGSCKAVEDVCNVIASGVVTEDEAPLYSTVGMARVRG